MDLVGPSFTKEIFYTGRRFSADEAKTMGLVNSIQQQTELDEYVADYVEAIAANAPLSLKATNLIVDELLKREEAQDLVLCQQLVDECASSEDIQEGRLAFMEKRKPRFVGR